MRKNSKVINYSIYKYTIEIIENVSIRYLVLKLLNYFLYFILIISKSILESSTEKILRAESNHLTVQIFDESFFKENKRTYKEKTLLLFFNARRALNSKFVLIQSIHTRLVQKENLVDSERCESDSRLVFFYTTEGKENRKKEDRWGKVARWLRRPVLGS